MASRNNDNRSSSLMWGIFLALAGIGLLLFNLGTFTRYEPYIQFGAAGLLGLFAFGFFGSYLSDLSHWWRLIPGWTLIALAAMVYLSTLPELDQRVTAGALFGGQAIAFVHVYLLDRAQRWWAIIPGGSMLTLGGTIALSSRTEDPVVLGTALFVGMGAVFFLLYLLGRRQQLWWTLIPGSVFVVFGLFLLSVGRSEQNLILRWWPVLLLLLGGWLSWRATRRPSSQKLATHTAPNRSRSQNPRAESRAHGQRLGEYSRPAPGASVEVLPEPEDGGHKASDENRSFIAMLWSTMRNFITNIWSTMRNFITKVWSMMSGFIARIWSMINQLVTR